ncbi:MAG: hypothetical protein PVF73_08455 [Bacteroidales bacterium]|jgi:hypothetical protein
MIKYKERKAKKEYYVLLKSGTVIGLYGQLKKLCETAKKEDKDFPSYSTLSKKKAQRMDFGEYSIQMIVLS